MPDDQFAFDLAKNTKSHDDWLAVVQFGMGTLLANQLLLAEIITAEATREAQKVPNHEPSDHVGPILRELNLRLSLA